MVVRRHFWIHFFRHGWGRKQKSESCFAVLKSTSEGSEDPVEGGKRGDDGVVY